MKVAMKTGWVSMPTNHKHRIWASDVKPIYFARLKSMTRMTLIK